MEGALCTLLRCGVYLTVDEFKGRRPVVRGTARLTVEPDQLRNPLSAFHVPLRSGGSRSGGTPVAMDLGFIRDCAVDTALFFAARGGTTWKKADWEVPGGGAVFRLLKYASFGVPPARWFSQIDPGAAGLHLRYRWSGRLMRWAGRMSGVSLPRPTHVPLQNPLAIAS